jgi:cobalt-precorrin 5A hydrolase
MKVFDIAIWTLNETGLNTALRLRNEQGVKIIFTPVSLVKFNNNPIITGYDNFTDRVCSAFNEYSAHLFIMATGIVIRTVSKLIKDKTIDPAIIAMDEMGKNIISLLSGHMGGANRLTLQLASTLKGNPVITTATDINNIIAVDTIAMETGSVIENKDNIKIVSAAMLRGDPVAMICDTDLYDKYYDNRGYRPDLFSNITDVNPNEYAAISIFSDRIFPISSELLQKTLIVRPPTILLGLGCNRNTSENEITETVDLALNKAGISPYSIAGVATIDNKRDEEGLISFCKSINKQLIFYSAEELNRVIYEKMSPPSVEAQKHVGANGVAEPAALLAAGKGVELIMNKIRSGNVTLAIARKRLI